MEAERARKKYAEQMRRDYDVLEDGYYEYYKDLDNTERFNGAALLPRDVHPNKVYERMRLAALWGRDRNMSKEAYERQLNVGKVQTA